MIRRPPRSTQSRSSAASDVYKRQSLATVTPSLVMRGAPKLLSITTLRPLGPSVTFTASARMSTPRSMRARASPPKRNSFAAMFFNPYLSAVEFDGETAPIGGSGGLLLAGGLALDDAHDVGLLHDCLLYT